MKDRDAITDRILRSAEKEFSMRGFHRAKVVDIARKAGVSVGSLYNFFKNKEDIFASLLENRLSSFRKEVQEAVERGDTIQSLMGIINAISIHMKKTGGFIRTIIMMHESIRPNIIGVTKKKLDNTMKEVHRTILSVMKKGIETGVLEDNPPAHLLASFMGLTISLLHHQLFERGVEVEESFKGTILKLFIEGAGKKGVQR